MWWAFQTKKGSQEKKEIMRLYTKPEQIADYTKLFKAHEVWMKMSNLRIQAIMLSSVGLESMRWENTENGYFQNPEIK